MKPYMALAVLVGTFLGLTVAGFAWPIVGWVLIPFGAGLFAFLVLFLGEGLVDEIRLSARMRAYERGVARERAAYDAEMRKVISGEVDGR
ncbi:hypothetical protein AB0C10_16000 [Microbispora amethystogenes]|uniref:hypothetical protein n=1 Tax=Microbispora amethystogenes TaxID=1427754 RepID=UPI0033DC49C0